MEVNWNKAWTNKVVLTVSWLLAILLVHPIGDFPLNDDFSYGRTAFNLVTLGRLQYDQWLSMTLVTQVLWGAGFSKLFGATFTVLRLSTLVLGLGGLLATYQLVKEQGQRPITALLATLAVAFNPVFFSLSFTFMSDVPFFAFGAMSSLYYARALRSAKNKWVLWGTLFALAATFVRQQGLMLPLAFGLAWLFAVGLRPKTVAMAAWPLLLHLAMFFAFSKWLETSQGLPDGYGDFGKLMRRLDLGIFQQMPVRLGVIMAYTGAALLPLSVLYWHSWWPSRPFFAKRNWPALLGLAFVLACAMAAWPKLPWGNMVYNFGVGPPTLKDGQFYLNISPTLPVWAIALLKILGFAGAAALFFMLKKQMPQRLQKLGDKRPVTVFALANMGLYLGFLLLDLHCFDRYFFQFLPFLLAFALPDGQPSICKKAKTISIALLAVMAALSIATTHDYLAWNRARWQALDYLTEKMQVTPDRIDGGFEFNGWHKPGPRHSGGGRSWWWVKDDEFVVAFGELGGYHTQQGFGFRRWLPPSTDSVFVLKRE